MTKIETCIFVLLHPLLIVDTYHYPSNKNANRHTNIYYPHSPQNHFLSCTTTYKILNIFLVVIADVVNVVFSSLSLSIMLSVMLIKVTSHSGRTESGATALMHI